MAKSKKGGKKPAAAAPAAAQAASTLYVLEPAPNSHGAMCLIEENKLPFSFSPLDLRKGDTRTPEFLAKNPFHCLPTLEDGSVVIWESHAIMRYLCNRHKLDSWFPQHSCEARAQVEQALDWRHCSFYPAVAKVCYPLLGFRPALDAKANAEALEGLKKQLADLESFYLKDGMFMSGFDQPTIADLSVAPCFGFVDVIPNFTLTPKIKAYLDRFVKAVPSYGKIRERVTAWLASMGGASSAKPEAKPQQQQAQGSSNKKSSNKNNKKKKKGKNDGGAAKGEAALDPKRVKACLKEGGKKGQDLGGMSVFGCHYFLTSMIEPQGEMKYLELCMEGANKKVDPNAEDRKGGAGDIAKIFFSAGDKTLSMICHVPKECTELGLHEYFNAVLTRIKDPNVVEVNEHMLKCEVQGDPDKGIFPLKLRDEVIAAGFEFLRSKNLILDDASDDDENYAEAAGVDLNAGADGSDY